MTTRGRRPLQIELTVYEAVCELAELLGAPHVQEAWRIERSDRALILEGALNRVGVTRSMILELWTCAWREEPVTPGITFSSLAQAERLAAGATAEHLAAAEAAAARRARGGRRRRFGLRNVLLSLDGALRQNLPPSSRSRTAWIIATVVMLYRRKTEPQGTPPLEYPTLDCAPAWKLPPPPDLRGNDRRRALARRIDKLIEPGL